MTEGPKLHWASKVLLVCAVFFALSIYFWGERVERLFRYEVVGMDRDGAVLVFDRLEGTVTRVRGTAQIYDKPLSKP